MERKSPAFHGVAGRIKMSVNQKAGINYKIETVKVVFLIEILRSFDFIPDISVIISFLLLLRRGFEVNILFLILSFIAILKFIIIRETQLLSPILSIFILSNYRKFETTNWLLAYSIILLIIFNSFVQISEPIRTEGIIRIRGFLYSKNATLIAVLLLGLALRKKITYLISLLILGIAQSKLVVPSILFSNRGVKVLLVFASIFFFNKFSWVFSRISYFYENRGIIFALFSGRIERLNEFNLNLTHVLIGSLSESATYEIEIIDLLNRYGLFFLILLFIFLYKEFKTFRTENKWIIAFVIFSLNFSGHLLENPIVILYFIYFLQSLDSNYNVSSSNIRRVRKPIVPV